MVERTFPRYFEDLNEKWRACCLCGFTNDSAESSEGGAVPTAVNGGCMYPESQLIEKDGKYYCHNHYVFRYNKKNLDDYIPEIPEEE